MCFGGNSTERKKNKLCNFTRLLKTLKKLCSKVIGSWGNKFCFYNQGVIGKLYISVISTFFFENQFPGFSNFCFFSHCSYIMKKVILWFLQISDNNFFRKRNLEIKLALKNKCKLSEHQKPMIWFLTWLILIAFIFWPTDYTGHWNLEVNYLQDH